MASGRRGGWRYTRTVIVFAGEKSKNAASPDEERCSALSRFLHQGKRNNTRQSRTASSGGFTACSGNSHPLLVPSRLLQNSGNNRAGQQVLVQCCLFSKWRYVAHAAVSGTVSHRLHELRQEDDASPPPSTSANEKRRPPLSRFIAQAQAKSPPAGGRRQGIPQSPLRFHSWLLSLRSLQNNPLSTSENLDFLSTFSSYTFQNRDKCKCSYADQHNTQK